VLTRYKQNLHIEGNKVISYTTHVATIDHATNTLYRHGHWSVTTSKHINYVAREYGLTIIDKPKEETKEDSTGELRTLKMVMAMGSIFANNQKEANDWDTKMLKAGLGGKGLIMPEGWDSLPEEEKTKRLNAVKKELK